MVINKGKCGTLPGLRYLCHCVRFLRVEFGNEPPEFYGERMFNHSEDKGFPAN